MTRRPAVPRWSRGGSSSTSRLTGGGRWVAGAALLVAVSGCTAAQPAARAGTPVTVAPAASGAAATPSHPPHGGLTRHRDGSTSAIAWEPPVPLGGGIDVRNDEVAVSGDVMVALETSSTEDAASTVVRTSSDGATWQVATRLDDVRLWSIATADNRFVAAGSRDSDDGRDIPVAATSPDGSHWHVTDLGCEVAGVAHDVAETPAGLVAVGSTSSRDGLPRPATWSSEDGVTWRAGSPEGFGDVVGGIRHVATAGSAVVAVGERQPDHGIGPQLAWWSDDGHRWNPSTPPQHWDGGVLAGDMASGSAGAVLVGTLNNSLGTAWAWRTTDGRSWESVALPALPGTGTSFPSDVASDGRRWVAVSDDVVDSGPTPGRHPGVWVSDDATSWRRVPMTDLDGPALQSLTDAKAVVVRDDRWFVYGTTTPEVDAPSGVEWVLWRGR